MKLRICILSEGYPADGHPYFAFVQNLCDNLVKQGHEITVIAPQSITKMIVRRESILPFVSFPNGVRVFRPLTASLSNLSPRFNRLCSKWAIARVLHKIHNDIDIYYGHFWHTALGLYPFAKHYNKPLFVASGECEIEVQNCATKEQLKCLSEYVIGVICVSSKNRDESIALNLTTEEKCIVLPNAIDNTIFKQTDRIAARKKFGAKDDDFVIAYVGGFIERKGPGRVAKAIEKLNDPQIKSIFVGYYSNGVLEDPQCNGIIYKGSLKHAEVAEALNAADLYIMPTKHEGCCNSIIEAMACGLPIISSDRPFNYDVLNESNSILVEPTDIDGIAMAIKSIRDNLEYRKRLSAGALAMAGSLSIDKRAKSIAKFIESRIK